MWIFTILSSLLNSNTINDLSLSTNVSIQRLVRTKRHSPKIYLSHQQHYNFFDKIDNIRSMWVGGIDAVWIQQFTQEKSPIFTKSLNYSKSSCILFYAKMFQYFPKIYCLQKESTHFDLRVSTHFGLEVSAQLGP